MATLGWPFICLKINNQHLSKQSHLPKSLRFKVRALHCALFMALETTQHSIQKTLKIQKFCITRAQWFDLRPHPLQFFMLVSPLMF
jgi:hypothetical protein